MSRYVLVIAAACGLFAATAQADVIISEIMYNPNSNESLPNDVEWLEIYNNGGSSEDISGWFIADEDGSSSTFPAATSIAAGEAIVLIWADQTVSDFEDAWGSGYQIIPVTNGLLGLSNSPSATNEILTLRDSGSNIMDEVNYDDVAPWPVIPPDGPSIYLLAGALDADSNDEGASWARCVDGVDGCYINTVTADFGGIDTGSPGVVVPEPSSLALVGLGLLGLLRRRR